MIHWLLLSTPPPTSCLTLTLIKIRRSDSEHNTYARAGNQLHRIVFKSDAPMMHKGAANRGNESDLVGVYYIRFQTVVWHYFLPLQLFKLENRKHIYWNSFTSFIATLIVQTNMLSKENFSLIGFPGLLKLMSDWLYRIAQTDGPVTNTATPAAPSWLEMISNLIRAYQS